MSTQQAPDELDRYLRALGAALADAPVEARDEILADVRAHADDALDQGRAVEDVLAALGPVAETAAQYRSELGLPSTPPASVRRAELLLHSAAVIVAVLTGILAALLVPFSHGLFEPPPASAGDLGLRTLVARHGAAGLLLAFAPALLAALPLLLPRRLRVAVGIAAAIAVASLAALTFTLIGHLFVPLAILMWAAVVVPWRVAHGLDVSASPLWRIFGGLLVALPGLYLLSALVTGAFSLTLETLLIALGVLLVGVLFALGLRAAFHLTALLGLLAMLLALFDAGLSRAPIWWTGGAWFAIGLSAVATLRPRGPRAEGDRQ